MALTSDEMQIMMTEVAEGLLMSQSRLAPLTERQRAFWERHETELIDIQARGNVVAFTPEMPDLGEYRKGYAPELKP